MLDVVLDFLVKNVNSWLALRGSPDFGQLELSSVVDDTGKWTITKDRIGLALINIEEERVLRSQLPETALIGGQQIALQPDLKLNLHLLFAAYFTRYDQALKYLSFVLTYFQSHSLFKQDEYPGLDSRVERLSIELQPLAFDQLNQIWAFVGAKQLPSAIYKVRMVALQDRETPVIATPITQITVDAHRS